MIYEMTHDVIYDLEITYHQVLMTILSNPNLDMNMIFGMNINMNRNLNMNPEMQI